MFAIEFFNWYDDVMWEQDNRPNSSVHILKIFRLLWRKLEYYKVHTVEFTSRSDTTIRAWIGRWFTRHRCPHFADWGVSKAASCNEFSHREEEFEEKYCSSTYLWKAWRKGHLYDDRLLCFHRKWYVREICWQEPGLLLQGILEMWQQDTGCSWCFGTRTWSSAEVSAQLERFDCLIYKSGVLMVVIYLRWFLFSNCAAEGVFHLPLVHYSYTYRDLTTSQWYGEEQQRATFPSVTCCIGLGTSCGERDIYTYWTCQPPAPEAVINLVKCGCRNGCTGWCIVLVITICHVQSCAVAWVTVATTDITP